MSDPVAARMLALQRRPVPTQRPTVLVRTSAAPVASAASVISAATSVRTSTKGVTKAVKSKKAAPVLKFHTRAASDDARYLSTMEVLPAPLMYDGELYPTMEHAYHAAKLDPKYAPGVTPARLAELRGRLQSTGDIAEPKAAKTYGGKGSFKKLKVTLDAAAFNPDRATIMKEIASARVLVDAKFADILRNAVSDGISLKHYERGKASEVFWGGDRNTLGRIYKEIGDMLVAEGESAKAEAAVLDEEPDATPLVAPPPLDWKAFRATATAAHTARAEKRMPLESVPAPRRVPSPSGTQARKAPPRAPKGTISQLSPDQSSIMSYDEARRIAVGDAVMADRLPARDLPVLKAPAYYLNNRQLFVWFITTLLSPYRKQLEEEAKTVTCETKTDADFQLMTHQTIVRDYMNLFTPYRGLLIYHGLGAGKTCASIAIAEGMKEQRTVTIMTPASLRVNYVEELKTCGDPLFRRNQHWEFVPCSAKSELCNALGTVLGIGPDAVGKAGGAWLTDPTKPSNTTKLSPEESNSLDAQINKMIQSKYRFINYNGITTRHYDELSDGGKRNPFDGQVVVVDEVHNLVSRIVNKLGNDDALAVRVYEDLVNAKDCRIVFLSGTPIVNYPNEMAVLFNMLRGTMRVYELPVTPTGRMKLGTKEMQKILSDINTIDVVEYRPTTRTLVVQRNPIGFSSVERRRQYIGVHAERKAGVSDEAILKEVQRELRKNGIQADWQVGVDTYLSEFRALPETMEAFTAMFIDPATGVMRNQSMLKRRILGLTSYFRSPSEALMPRYDPTKDFHTHLIPMSNYQFTLYETERAIERKQEGRSGRPKQSNVYKEATSTYRIFSRAFCNFVFPAQIARPKPSDEDVGTTVEGTPPVLDDDIMDAAALAVRGTPADATAARADEDDEETLRETKYADRIIQALAELEANAAEYLTPDGLETLSPKFLRVLEEIQKYPDACQLVYSQFRTIEGIGVLRLILLANGFAEFKIGKDQLGEWVVATPEAERSKPMFVLYTGTESADEKEIIRNAFNGAWDKTPPKVASVLRALAPNNIYGQVIRVFMITASGAEGITTRNVRHVHLVEPYWHPVRTEQVVGRAMRICSHQALPPKDRTVSVNLYLMTFTDEQRAEATKEMLQSDKSRVNPAIIVTSDETLNEISTIKAEINAQLLKAVKEAAIDCALYSEALKDEDLNCVAFPEASPKQMSFVPSIVQEETAPIEASNKRSVSWSAVEVTIGDTKYALRKSTKKLYDLNSYLSAVDASKQGKQMNPVFVGIMHETKGGKVTVKMPWEV